MSQRISVRSESGSEMRPWLVRFDSAYSFHGLDAFEGTAYAGVVGREQLESVGLDLEVGLSSGSHRGASFFSGGDYRRS